VIAFLRQTGVFVGWLLANAAAYCDVFLDALRHPARIFRNPGRRVLLKQVYFTGIEALPLVAVTALLTGYTATAQLYLGLLRDMALTLDMFRLLIVQHSSILIVALFVLARSGSAIAAELAEMRRHGEVASLYRLGIDPASYLVAPRVVACLLSVPALAAIFQVIMVFGGFGLMALFEGWDFNRTLSEYARGIALGHGFVMVLKALVFGACIGAICCRQGLAAMPGPLGVPVATRTAMVHGFTAIVLAEVGFFLLFG
jgi:phospholipid/cholesterol/gamma-HCH transport system permease protein